MPGDGGAPAIRWRIEELERRLARARAGGSPREVARQRAQGKLTARERIALLLEEGSFVEMGALARHRSAELNERRPSGDGIVTGFGLVDGRRVCVYAQDYTVLGGTAGEVFGRKATAIVEMATRTGCPIVGIHDSGGARIQEGVLALGGYADFVRRQVIASGVIPQVSLVMGPCAGGAAYSPALTDFIVMVEGTSSMFVTGPDIIREVTGEVVGVEELGGAQLHNTTSGVAHHLAHGETEAIEFVQDLLSYLPGNNMESPPVLDAEPRPDVTERDHELDDVIPEAANHAYDMRVVVEHVLDDGDLLEIHALFAPNILCGFGRVEGRTVGVVANQPLHLAGVLDIDASEKAARFIRFCDAFGIPILTFVDVPGYLPGTDQERSGMIRRGAKLLYAYAEATVPKLTVVTRKAYGGGYAIMGSKHLGGDLNLAWPGAEIAVMGAAGAVDVLHRRRLAEADDPAALRAELIQAYQDRFAHPYDAADHGFVDAVIRPSETRPTLAAGLRALRSRRESHPPRKHSNLPL